MIKKKLTKLVGLKKAEFDAYVEAGQIQLQKANLIPVFKTGDEMALTSIFLSSLRLIKEYRSTVFKELKLSRGGKAYYYLEASFPEIGKARIDGLIIIVVSGIIKEAAFFEMKNKNNKIDKLQIESYIEIGKKLGISNFITVSNEFVADSSISPIDIKVPKNIKLSHFSWTYLLTIGQILLFNNDDNIEDEDQIEIMREVLTYIENPVSGVSGYTHMKPGWKEMAENVRARKPMKTSDPYVEDAVLSWYEEERDMALLMSRKLGILVKSSSNNKSALKNDLNTLIKKHSLTGNLNVKDSVSDIKILVEFDHRSVSMGVKVIPPLDKGTIGRIGWIAKQLENCSKRSDDVFNRISKNIWVEADIKYAKTNVKVSLSELDSLKELTKGKEVQAFKIVLIQGFGSNFASVKKFVELIEIMVLDYYEGIVQHLSNWNRPAPKIVQKTD